MKKYTIEIYGKLSRVAEIYDDFTEEDIENINYDDEDEATTVIDNDSRINVKDENGDIVVNCELLTVLNGNTNEYELPDEYEEDRVHYVLEISILLEDKFDINKLSINRLGEVGFNYKSLKYEGTVINDYDKRVIDWEDFDFEMYLDTY